MADDSGIFLGIDVGTSGLRAVCIDEGGMTVDSERATISKADRKQLRKPSIWKDTLCRVLAALSARVDLGRVRSLCVDGQSGTVLLANEFGEPLDDVSLLYNDTPTSESVAALNGTHGSAPLPLARGLDLLRATGRLPKSRLLHQADWIAGLFTDRFDRSDHNNALKTGYRPDRGRWKFDTNDVPGGLLPDVLPTGAVTGRCVSSFARAFGLGESALVAAGTTDGMAGFIAAAGLAEFTPGLAVTSLGTTLVVKTISTNEVVSPKHGVYSHRLFSSWVAGGASNAGAGALLEFFKPEELSRLSQGIDPARRSALDYYPLVTPGERFPVDDPDMKAKVEPRPDDDTAFLAGLLESLARIEKRAYEVIAQNGGQYPASVATVGGGSRNAVWTEIRQRVLGVRVFTAAETEAAYGSALLARRSALR